MNLPFFGNNYPLGWVNDNSEPSNITSLHYMKQCSMLMQGWLKYVPMLPISVYQRQFYILGNLWNAGKVNLIVVVRHKHRLRSTTPTTTLDLPPVLFSEQGRNITYLLGETVLLKCTVLGYKQGVHTVSWTRTTRRNSNPTALTFGDKVRPAKLWLVCSWWGCGLVYLACLDDFVWIVKQAGAELGQAQLKLELELCCTSFQILSYR